MTETTPRPRPGPVGAGPSPAPTPVAASGTGSSASAATHGSPGTAGDRVRLVLRGLGQTLITLGVVVVLFIVYEVWISNWFSERENKQLVQRLEQQWALPGGGPNTIPVGDALGILYIPRLGQDYAWAIVQGDAVPNQDQLAKGPAHYGRTAFPGRRGNFAVAGHRVGKGEPFLNLDDLVPGDPVIVETRQGWFVYRVKGRQHGLTQPDADGIPGREIVAPSDGDVLLPVPDHPGVPAQDRYMTMTTCNPKFTAENRLIVYSTLDFTAPFVDGGKTMPAKVQALYEKVSD
jgi:sortase A